MQNFTDVCSKERAEYPEHNTLHIENVVKITVDIDSITPQKKKNGR